MIDNQILEKPNAQMSLQKDVVPQEVKLKNRNRFKNDSSDSCSDEAGTVKSVAIVKYSAVEAPAAYTRLRCNTNLNLPPSNWLSSSIETYGLQPVLLHRSGFSSFKMAHMFPDCVGEVDVVSDAENMKKLLKIPYSHGPVSMMIHRIENTLLIDEFDIHKYLLREAESQWEWFKKFFIEHVMQSMNAKDKLVHHKDKSRNALQQKSLVSKFLYHSLVMAEPDDSKIEKNEEGEPKKADPSVAIPLPFKNCDPQLPEPTMEEGLPDPTSNHKFSRNVVWTFEDIQMLLGTDMPIFGGGTHPCISLRLRDVTKPINVLTGMDYWLDNLMCNVPEVVMCYHLNGIVQKYELIKTEDLPHLENSKFSPKVIRDIAQNILSFLKANATKAGHTYWLFKGKDDDVVKLYDLTSLCTDVMDDKGETPFTVPVAMLLYRVARNMKNSSDGSRQASTIRMLLQNCVSLLSAEKYPQIVTSAHYMLSDLYVPATINPVSPDFTSDEVVPENPSYDKERVNDTKDSKDLAIKSLSLANISEILMEETEYIPPPPPLGCNVESRCIDGLKHVISGLHALEFLCEPEEEKDQATANEDPVMAKPHESIPMPYQPLVNEKDVKPEEKVENSKKKNRKKKKEPKISEEAAKGLLCKTKTDAAVPPWNSSTSQCKGSWTIHLKTLLYEKACLIYATLLEKSYSDQKFGVALHYIRMVLKTRKVLGFLHSNLPSNSMKSYLLGRAGDAFFMVVQNSANIDVYNKEYSSLSDFDNDIIEEFKKEGLKDNDEDDDVFLPSLKNLEDLLKASTLCYQKALTFKTSQAEHDNLQRRLGNIENELGVYYMNLAAVKYQGELSEDSKDNDEKASKFKKLFLESLKHLEFGIKAFDSVKDEANLALLHSNTGRLMRLRAHFHSPNDGDRKELAGQERHYYGKAIASYQKALHVLGERKYNPAIWDSVNWELSTAVYTMATLLQDYPACVRNQEEAEREVTEMLHKALKYCDVETPGMRQPLYQFRCAMIHHRLASLYHECYRNSSDEDNRNKKALQLSKLHYEKSAKLLAYLEHPAEYLRVQLERVALAEFQAESSSGQNGRLKYYENALELLVEAKPILKLVAERENCPDAAEKTDKTLCKMKMIEEESTKKEVTEEKDNDNKTDYENELNLLILFEQRIQFILLSLTKSFIGKGSSKKEKPGEVYKKMYAMSLRGNSNKSNPVEVARALHNVVSEISVNMFPPSKPS